MELAIAALIGGIGGAFVFLVCIVVFFWND
jgi:hypothetical protein